MAVLQRRFLIFIKKMLNNSLDDDLPVFKTCPLLARLVARQQQDPAKRDIVLPSGPFSGSQTAAITCANSAVASFLAAFPDGVLNSDIDQHTERRIVALKRGFARMPATTAAIIVRGFRAELTECEVLDVFASHGLSRDTQSLAEKWDFTQINRRAEKLDKLLRDPTCRNVQRLNERCLGLLAWMTAPRGKKEAVLKALPVKRSLFFYWWSLVSRLGLLGLVDPGRELFRTSKIGVGNEAKIVIDRLQHPERSDSYYVQRLAFMGIEVKRNAVAKVFSRWGVREYCSAFVSNLQRLEALPEEVKEPTPTQTSFPERLVDEHYVKLLEGIRKYPLSFAAPGLMTLWAYIEELGLFPLLKGMDLTEPYGRQKYAWFDLLLFDIARRFYGIPTLSAACENEGWDMAFFTHLCKLPCNDTILDGLGAIDEKKVRQIRLWIIERLAQLDLTTGKKVAFDFHQIDQNVLLEKLRNFGKGPSPKKKICYAGFRPHIAVDVNTGTLLVAEFRKSSARGTSTVKRFVREYILPVFKGLFETVYIDSEYTGKDVWNFILNKRQGMGADLTGCLKQNALVKKARDHFLMENRSQKNLWCYHDDEHVYADGTFPIEWTYVESPDRKEQILKLTCVVKKHVTTGKLRCFGTSKHQLNAKQIMDDYSSRWTVEICIKDLVGSYFFDKCPGENPHHVDVHFLVTTICRTLYRMIERDLGEFLKNPDRTVKTLGRMRESLIRQGPAQIAFQDDMLAVSFDNAYSIPRTKMLKCWFDTLSARHSDGLGLLGGLKLGFELRPPLGDEHRNAGTRVPLSVLKSSRSDVEDHHFS